jgi:dipeptidyl-peptidase-4
MTEVETPFAAGVAGAPVTDWRLYDTHYTERYLGKPDEDPKVYEDADVVRRAGRLQKPLLLIHGTADDNVLFENSLRLIEAFQKQSIPFELMIYPGHAHGVQGREAQLHLYRMIATFFARHLGVTLNPRSI